MVAIRTFIAATAAATLASAANHTIVAKADLTFSPAEIKADEGDWLVFEFEAKNHSVASGPFTSPCEPFNTTGGFFSGFFPTESGTNPDTFTVQVTNASVPIWFYCTQGKHCANGMVGVVNPTSQRTLDMYKAGAKAFDKAGVSPAAVAGGVVEVAAPDGAAASLGMSMAAAAAGLLGAVMLVL